MSDQIISSIITAVGGLIGGIIGAIGAIIAAKIKAGQPPAPKRDTVPKRDIHWFWWIIIGFFIGATVTFITLNPFKSIPSVPQIIDTDLSIPTGNLLFNESFDDGFAHGFSFNVGNWKIVQENSWHG